MASTTSKVRTEFVASWKAWEGAVCITLDDYEDLELEVAALREQVARLMKAPEDTLREQLAAARREMRERCAATAGKKSSWTYDPHDEDADYWQGYKYGRRDAETAIRALPDEQEQI